MGPQTRVSALLLGASSGKRAAQGYDNLCTRVSAGSTHAVEKLLQKVNKHKMEQSMERGARTALVDLMRK